jgi:hypothetical protein
MTKSKREPLHPAIQHLARKRGSTPVGTLRKQFGPHFAPGARDSDRLGALLDTLDYGSLAQLLADERGSESCEYLGLAITLH